MSAFVFIDNNMLYKVKSDIEFGSKGVIPLWMFGLLY